MITQAEFLQRRQRIMHAIQPDSVVILPAAHEFKRNHDSDYLYRQNSDFYYLTGFREPEAVMVLAPGRKEGEYILFNRERNFDAEVWVGARSGQEGAREHYHADQAFPINSIDVKMLEILTGRRRIYYPVGQDSIIDQQMIEWINQLRRQIRSGTNAPNEFIDISQILHEMRLLKSPAEIELMRQAAQVSAAAHRRAMQVCKPGMMEYELQAELLFEFCRHDCYPSAYNSIVGGGANSCVLHYVDNNTKLKDGDLVLIDAGGEYQYYASDITRTFPVNGRFSPEQRAIYELVLQAQLATIARVKVGTPWNELQDIPRQIITEGLVELGLLKGNVKDLLETHAYQCFYMHNIGHWLGLDVHDVGNYRVNQQWRRLETGIVLTVEPGIYIRPDANVDKKWWNIGVRIEDDVLVTEQGHEVLSKDALKQIDEIERLMKK